MTNFATLYGTFKFYTLYALNNYLFICYAHRYVVCAVVSLIDVTEVVLVTSSEKKKIIGKYWKKWLTVRLRGRRRPRATSRGKAWMENMKYEDLVRMTQRRYE